MSVSPQELTSHRFYTEYTAGLGQMLENPSAGKLITAAANLLIVRDLQHQDRILDLASRMVQSQAQTNDHLMLQRALDAGILDEESGAYLSKTTGPWNVSHFPLRALKPPGKATERVDSIRADLRPGDFTFNDVADEIFLEQPVGDVTASVFYQKYPFAQYHTVVVPNRGEFLPQFLTEKYHHFASEFMYDAPAGSTLGYNSIGAFASVNQLHFQLVAGHDQFPADSQAVDPYPAIYEEFDSPNEAWSYINMMNRADMPYSLNYVHGKTIAFPRRFQGTYQNPAVTSGIAWYEMGGNMHMPTRAIYESATQDQIYDAIRQASAWN